MRVLCKDFKDNERIPVRFTADRKNVNPELIIEDVPKNVKSFVLIVDDPDAQRVCGFTWIHWVVFDIPVLNGKLTIKENSIPGVYGESTYKKPGYGGPNPPPGSGVHHYHFKIYAIDRILGLKPGAKLKEIENEMKNHILDKAELIGVYSRE